MHQTMLMYTIVVLFILLVIMEVFAWLRSEQLEKFVDESESRFDVDLDVAMDFHIKNEGVKRDVTFKLFTACTVLELMQTAISGTIMVDKGKVVTIETPIPITDFIADKDYQELVQNMVKANLLLTDTNRQITIGVIRVQ